jgi:hypothetical protein
MCSARLRRARHSDAGPIVQKEGLWRAIDGGQPLALSLNFAHFPQIVK